MPGVPTDADALAGLPPPRDVLAHGVDHADHLVPRDAREGDAGPLALLGKDVAVADAAGLTLIRTDPGPGSGIGRSTSSRGLPGRETWATRIVAMRMSSLSPVVLRRVTRARREPKSAGFHGPPFGSSKCGRTVTSHDPYSLPFSGTVTSLASRGCRITARRRVFAVLLGFLATRWTQPDGS